MPQRTRIAVIDRHPLFRHGVASALASDKRFDVIADGGLTTPPPVSASISAAVVRRHPESIGAAPTMCPTFVGPIESFGPRQGPL